MNKKRLDRFFRADEKHGMTALALVSGPRGCYSYPENSGDFTFLLAEASRMFTAVLAARLVEKGLLKFDTGAGDILSREGVPENKTIRQLLEGDGSNPGNGILLDKALEKAGGMPLADLLHREIIDALCMKSTYVLFASKPQAAAALQYQTPRAAGDDVREEERLKEILKGGHIVSSPSDLMIFQRALYKGTLISPDMLTRMQKAAPVEGHGIPRGMGFMEMSPHLPGLIPRQLPLIRGYSGSLAVHVYFDPGFNTHYVLSYGDTAHVKHAEMRLAQMVAAS